MAGRKFEDLPWSERYHVLSLGFREYAQRAAKRSGQDTSWLTKLKDYLETAGGVTGDVSTQIAGAATDPKNIAIGSTGLISPVIPSTYFFLEGASRMPGEARKVVQNPSYENIISSGLTATQVLGAGAETSEAAMDRLNKNPTTGAGTRIAQSSARTGPELAKSVVEKEEALRTASANRVAAKKTEFAVKAKRLNEDYDSKVADIKKKYADDVAARERAITEAEAKHVQEVGKAVEEYKIKLADAAHERKGQALLESHRQKLETQDQALAESVLSNVKNTGSLIEKDFDKRWDNAREIAGKDAPMDSVASKGIIEEAQGMLHGVPSDITLFKSILGELEDTRGSADKDTVDLHGGQPLKTQTWDAMRTQFSALGNKMYAGDLPGNVFNALKLVRDGYKPGENAETANAVQDPRSFDAQLTKRMESKGAGEIYRKLKSDYSQYMRDWKDNRSIPGQNGPISPLARLYGSVDPGTTIKHSTGPFTDRLIQQFGQYDKFGAAPSVINTLRDNNFELTKLPKGKYVPEPTVSVPTAPERPEPVNPPVEAITKTNKDRAIDMQRMKEDELAAISKLDKSRSPEQILAALKKIKETKAAKKTADVRSLNKHDKIMVAVTTGLGAEALMGNGSLIKYAPIYLAYRMGEIAAYRSPKFQEALTKITDRDIAELNKLYEKYPGEKAEAQRVFAGGLESRAQQGLPAPPLQRFAQFLTSDQMKKILRAYAVASPKTGQQNSEPINIAPPTQSPMQVAVQ
jgi:hypothetical protein